MLASICSCTSPQAQAQAGQEYVLNLRIEHRQDGGLDFLGNAKVVEVDAQTAAEILAVRFTVECWVEPECRDQRAEPVERERKTLDNGALASLLSAAGERVLAPFAEDIRKAAILRIEVPPTLVKLAVDVLEFEGQPLY